MERIQSQLFLSSKNYWMTVSPPFESYWLPITKCPLFMMLKVVCWFRPGAPVGGSMHYGRAVRIFNSYQSPSRSSTRLNQAISNSACLVGLIPECWILSLHRVAPSPNCVLTSERTGMLTLLSAPDSRYNIQYYLSAAVRVNKLISAGKTHIIACLCESTLIKSCFFHVY